MPASRRSGTASCSPATCWSSLGGACASRRRRQPGKDTPPTRRAPTNRTEVRRERLGRRPLLVLGCRKCLQQGSHLTLHLPVLDTAQQADNLIVERRRL